MKKIITTLVSAFLGLALLGVLAVYFIFNASLPKLSDSLTSSSISDPLIVARDNLGTAIIQANSRADAAYGLGYAHGQDRFFQMDLLRRNAAGELAEIFGEKALELDKSRRFHQLRKRAMMILDTLPAADKTLLDKYAQGVNDALAAQAVASFEYLLTQSSPTPWHPSDSLLVIYSMYLDLQSNTINRDLALTVLQQHFGQHMVDFIIQPSPYQAALDGSELPLESIEIPQIAAKDLQQANITDIADIAEIGSNNWAVSGTLTKSGKGMLSDDMHLSFAVPIIWYRAQLNYQTSAQQEVQVTGVSLPGAPAIVVGSNNHLAWGFTNAYIDTADWVRLTDEQTLVVEEVINTPDGEHIYPLEVSTYGPVVDIAGGKYALNWVAHQPYAVDMSLMQLEQIKTVSDAVTQASRFGVPVQNLVLADKSGDIGWTLAGAILNRTTPQNSAITAQEVDPYVWQQRAASSPSLINPESHRIWTANSRVVSTQQHQALGDGGYALGARAVQIRAGLMAKDKFDEDDFYELQLDNQAQFLLPWHQYLSKVLRDNTQQADQDFAKDLKQLKEWQGCACSESVGYTLTRYFRTEMINIVFAPLETTLAEQGLSLAVLKRYLEPAIWQMIDQQPQSWLPEQYQSWDDLVLGAYVQSKQKLLAKYSDNNKLTDLTWGRVNALTIQHPFSKSMPILAKLLDMPVRAGFGDSFMPAVQGKSFGASQRFIVQPGLEKNAIMTIPGGQSGHPLSDFYRSGFNDYINHRKTPLLPSQSIHEIRFTPAQ
ncbi:penicillin acylase family protein [Shewanella gaetbuli]|uniref:Penicillin acylase family protein n=1 Tax=Shewanella gaetbuli TaxID=220752 RepID=A0A9X1ZMR3_9GAMM|nr:penicillin acylase family protein [Shewanella gaetbuli]MCL1143802.1 penicillin acylase family protein [Shewanella gaetbuli]